MFVVIQNHAGRVSRVRVIMCNAFNIFYEDGHVGRNSSIEVSKASKITSHASKGLRDVQSVA